jgi:ABC-type polysaccharide/polyol phosphate transport system ATPase subunit
VARFAGLEEFMDAPVRVYSAGMKARLGFAIVVLTDPDILVLDEVMEVGDEEFRARSRERLRDLIDRGRTVIVATHNVDEAVGFCDRMIRLHQGRMVEIGDPQDVAAHYLAEPRTPEPVRGRRAR